MSIDVTFQEKNNYLSAVIDGEFDPTAVHEILIQIRDRAQQTGFNRILVDAFALSAPSTDFFRYLVGISVAELLPRPFKVAALYEAKLINKFAENTAVNRGANFQVCGNCDEALGWLLDDLPSNEGE